MKKHYIFTLFLSVTLVAVTLSYKSAKVAVKNASTIEIENDLPVMENIATNVEIKQKEEIVEQPMTVVLEGKTISTKDVKSEKQEYIVASRGGEIKEPKEYKEFIISFYTNTPEENGGYTVTCEGKPLVYGIVASNYFKLGTQIYLEEYDTVFTVADKGGKSFNNSNRLDMLIPRNKGESLSAYKKRVNDLGKKKIHGIIIK